MTNFIYFQANTNTLPLVHMADQVYIPGPNIHFRRQPEEYILYFILDGTMKLIEGDQLYTLGRGDILLLDPSREHNGIRDISKIEYLYLHFQWDMIELDISIPELSNLKLKQELAYESDAAQLYNSESIYLPKLLHLTSPYFESVITKMSNIIELLKTMRTHKAAFINCKCMELLLMLDDYAMKNQQNDTPASDKRTLEIIDYIHEHFREDITSTQLADTFYSNYDYLNRCFKKHTGKTIFSYLNEFRIHVAKKLLLSGYYTNKYIADAIGFHNEFYFSKVFKQYTGVSPREYKKL